MKFSHSVAALFILACSSINAATVTFDNFTPTVDNAQLILNAAGVAAPDSTYHGAIGKFTISDSAITTAFSAADSDMAAISSGFLQFGTSFGLLDAGNGAFQASVSGDTKVASNTFGGSAIYAVFYKGATLAGATELLIAKLTSTLPTDPTVGAPLLASASLNSQSLAPGGLLVGSVGAPMDAGFGGPSVSSFQMSAINVSGVPEPSRALLLGFGALGLMFRRRRA